MDDMKCCGIHGLTYLNCTADNCGKKVCKLCLMTTKEDLQHALDHYDNLKSSDSFEEMIVLKKNLKQDETYDELNKIVLKFAESICNNDDPLFINIIRYKQMINFKIIEGSIHKYTEITDGFEQLVKNLTTKLNNLNSSDSKLKSEISAMKKELDSRLSFLSSNEVIESSFRELSEKAEKYLKGVTIKNVLENKMTFSLIKSLTNLNWLGLDTNKAISSTHSGYYTFRSEEVLKGAFFCKINIIRINASNVSSYWNYSYGLIKATSTGNDNNYYDSSVILQSNGYLANQFSGSGSHKQIFYHNWKDGDQLLLKRDENNRVFFGVNDDANMVLGFDNISGEYRIVLGFGSSMLNDEFELNELIIN